MAKRPLYDVHPSMRLIEHWIETVKPKTGKSLTEWMKYIQKEGPETEVARRDWLKKEFDLGTNTAWWLAERSVGKGLDENPQEYLRAAPAWIEAMYAKKPQLRPIHDALISMARGLADDVKVCPCQTIVPIFRTHVIAQIKPSTKTRLDFGLALGALMKQRTTKFPARLVDTGGFAKKDRITHRIEITSPEQVDDAVRTWLTEAYEADPPKADPTRDH